MVSERIEAPKVIVSRRAHQTCKLASAELSDVISILKTRRIRTFGRQLAAHGPTIKTLLVLIIVLISCQTDLLWRVNGYGTEGRSVPVSGVRLVKTVRCLICLDLCHMTENDVSIVAHL